MMFNKAISLSFLLCACCFGDDDFGFFSDCKGKYGENSLSHPDEISPEKIKLKHITPLLDSIEVSFISGKRPRTPTSVAFRYIMNYITDERFSATIHEQYAKRLFEKFGDKRGDAVLLYYRTGGDLNRLRELYGRSKIEEIKKEIEWCFLDANAELLERHTSLDMNAGSGSPRLSVKLTSKPVMWTNAFGTSTFATNAMGVLDNKYDVSIKFENVGPYPIKVNIPTGSFGIYNGNFRISRKDQGHIILDGAKNGIDREMILYPKDRYIMNTRVSLRGEGTGVNYDSYLYFQRRAVKLWDHRLSTRPDRRLDINIQYECEYSRFRKHNPRKETNNSGGIDKKTSVLSNIVPLTYLPSKKAVMEKKDEQVQAWRDIVSEYEKQKRMVEKAGGGVYVESIF